MMKAKEQIWLNDYIVKEDNMFRRMTMEELTDGVTPHTIAGNYANIGDEVVVYTNDTVFEVEL